MDINSKQIDIKKINHNIKEIYIKTMRSHFSPIKLDKNVKII